MVRAIWDAWNGYARRAAWYQSTLVLYLVYAVALGLTALVSIMARSPLLPATPQTAASCWIDRKPAPRDLPSLERLFS